jgi:EmrB/QacA subfamily drug resistance transporter
VLSAAPEEAPMSVKDAPSEVNTFGVPPEVYHKRWLILAVLNISLVMVVTAVSSLNVALPTIQTKLNTSGTQLQWIVDAYALVFAGLLLPAGALGDRFGRKYSLQAGLVIFGVAAFIASQSSSANALISMRAVLGIGAALIMPSTLSIIINSFPFHERPKAVAIWSAFAGVGGALGPITSGLLLKHFWWGSVFFINIPLVIILLGLSIRIIPNSKDPAGHALDPGGAILSTLGLVALVFAVIEGPDQGWGDIKTIGAFLVAGVALAAFVQYELRLANPMLDPRLFRLPGFSGGSAAVTLVFFSMFGMFFLLTQYLQYVQDYDALGTGVRVLPSAFMLMLVAPQGPKLIGRFGVRRVLRTGFLVSAVGMALFASATASSGYWVVALGLICAGGGIAMVMPGASQHIVGSVPLSKAGVGSAMNDVTREVGGALGIAVAGSIVASVYRGRTGFADQMIKDPTARELAKDSIGKATGVAAHALNTKPPLITIDQYNALRSAASDSFTHGTRIAFIVMASLSVIAGLVISRVIPNMLPQRQIPNAPAASS